MTTEHIGLIFAALIATIPTFVYVGRWLDRGGRGES